MNRNLINIFILIVSLTFLIGAVVILDVFDSHASSLYSYESTATNHGIYKERFSDGSTRFYEEYSNGLKHGIEIEFKHNKDTVTFFHYENGYKNGLARFFASNGQPVLEEVYKDGRLKERNIINDSLYVYDYKKLETGHLAYKIACEECHTSNKELQNFSAYTMDFETLDSLHLCRVDSLFSVVSMSNYMSINSSDLESLEAYIFSLKESEKRRYNKSIVHRNKKKRLVSK